MSPTPSFGWLVFVVVVMLLATKALFDLGAAAMAWFVDWYDSRYPPRVDRPLEDQWFTLPGQRLELGNTGFWISFSAQREIGRQLVLFSPEGRNVACGPEHLLDEMKQHAELRAATRLVFNTVSQQGKGAGT